MPLHNFFPLFLKFKKRICHYKNFPEEHSYMEISFYKSIRTNIFLQNLCIFNSSTLFVVLKGPFLTLHKT